MCVCAVGTVCLCSLEAICLSNAPRASTVLSHGVHSVVCVCVLESGCPQMCVCVGVCVGVVWVVWVLGVCVLGCVVVCVGVRVCVVCVSRVACVYVCLLGFTVSTHRNTHYFCLEVSVL